MARKLTNYTVTDEGRDLGKVFVITEMSAAKAENFAFRALMALVSGNVQIPDNSKHAGMAGLAEIGFRMLSSLKLDVAMPLFDEMFECVQIMPDPNRPHVTRAIIDADIEEVLTRFRLRMAIWDLHVDFLKAALPSILGGGAAQAMASNTQSAQTSQGQS